MDTTTKGKTDLQLCLCWQKLWVYIIIISLSSLVKDVKSYVWSIILTLGNKEHKILLLLRF